MSSKPEAPSLAEQIAAAHRICSLFVSESLYAPGGYVANESLV